MNEYTQATVTILSLVNPAICVAMFVEIENGRPGGKQIADATGAAVALLIILTVSAVAGAKVLSLFGISLDAFQVAGGGVLAWMGFSMLRAPATKPASAQTADEEKPSLIPLILFAASPGTITGVITLSVHHSGSDFPVTAIAGAGAAVTVTWVLLLLATRSKPKSGGPGLAGQIVPKFMGLIVIAMGVQFILSGLKAFAGTA